MESSETNPEILETDFYRQVESLPEQIASVWVTRYEELDEPDDDLTIFYQEFKDFLLKRKMALSGSLEVHTEVNEEIRKEILSVHEAIKNGFGNPELFLGNGWTAETYTLSIAPHLCVKYITDQNAYNENNHMRTEYEYLDELHHFEVNNIRTPHPYFLRIHPSEGHSYGMERIMGENLSRILECPKKNLELIKLAKTLDRVAVEQNLLLYITQMHEQFGITHNDLFRRNIMLSEDGLFYIIDFGKAKHEQVGEDHEQFRKSDLALISSEIKKFFRDIDNLDIE